jgi:hypothetical protein
MKTLPTLPVDRLIKQKLIAKRLKKCGADAISQNLAAMRFRLVLMAR